MQNKLAKVMAEQGLTTKQLVELSGVSKNCINSYKRGAITYPRREILSKLAIALKTPVKELLENEQENMADNLNSIHLRSWNACR